MARSRTPEELPAFFDELALWAAAEGAGIDVETVPYGDHADQVMDVRRPAGDACGTVLVLHGGFWRAPFTRLNTVALATALTLRGWVTVNAEYRRGGPGAWREMLDDVRAAAEKAGPDVTIGHSAGGHLALWAAARTRVARAVALGGVCDLRAAAAAGLGAGATQELLGGEPGDVPDAYAAADPVALLPLGAAQVLVHGTDDDRVPLENARGYAALARAAGDDCALVELQGVDHFDVIDPRHACFEAVAGALGR